MYRALHALTWICAPFRPRVADSLLPKPRHATYNPPRFQPRLADKAVAGATHNAQGQSTTMRLTLFTDYGLRMLMRLASSPDKIFSTAELAGEFGLSRNHLAKIMQHLSGAGLIETRRGGGGGATLAKPASDIRLGDVVAVLEEGQAIVECFARDGGQCTFDQRCGLKTRLRSAEAAFIADLNRSTLADIAFFPRKAADPARSELQAL